MNISGLPEMYTQSQRAEGVAIHIRQTTYAHGITVANMCHMTPPLATWKQLKPGSASLQDHCIYGKVVGKDCG